MVEASALKEVGGKLFGNVTAGLLFAVIGIIIFGIIIYLFWYFGWYKKKFDILIKVTSKRAGDARVFFDWAAILNDRKNKTKYVRLLKTKVELPIPPFKVLQQTNMGDYGELERTSEDTFRWLTSSVIDREYVIRLDGKRYPVASTKLIPLEQDVYWILKRKENVKNLLDPESIMTKLIQLLPVIVPAFIMLLLTWVFFDKFPEVLRTAKELITATSSTAATTSATG